MADNNQYRRVEQVDFLDNDPFAELTRIMGHDPRADARDVRQDHDVLQLDLEKEMMGGLGFEEFDEVDPAPATDAVRSWSTVAEAPSITPEEYAPIEASEEPAPYAEAQQAPVPFHEEPREAPVSHDGGAYGDAALQAHGHAAGDEHDPFAGFDMDGEIARSLDALETADDHAMSVAPVEADADASDRAGEYPHYGAASIWSELAAADPVEDIASAVQEPASEPWHAAQAAHPAYDEPAFDHQPPAEDAYPPAQHDADPVDVAYAQHEEPAVAGGQFASVHEAASGWGDHEAANAAPLDLDLSSFEDALAAEVGRIEVQDEDVSDFAPAAPEDYGQAPAEAVQAPEEAGQDGVGYAEFEQASVAALPAQEPFRAEPTHAGPPHAEPLGTEIVQHDPVQNEPANDEPMPPEPALSLEDELEAMLASTTAAAAPVVAAAAWRPSVETFGRGNLRPLDGAIARRGAEERAHVPQPAPRPVSEPVLEDVAEVEFDLAGDLEAAFDSSFENFAAEARAEEFDAAPFEVAPPPEPDYGAPHIDTVDIPETVVPVAEDFDVPELHHEEHSLPPAQFDELETEFAQTYAASEAAAQAVDAGGWERPSEWDQPQAADGQPQDWAAYAQPAEDYRYDQDFDEAMSIALYDAQEVEAAPSRRRGMLVAAIVAGVAIIGGAGVFGMSMIGQGSDEPVLIRADADPMKVRPEEPGGIVVPNQEAEVYQRVAGATRDVSPSQAELLTTAEEPIDVAAQTEPLLPPSIFGEEDEDVTGVAAPKAEDRIEVAEPVGTSTAASDEFVSVAPRRVRTMIVRPDGSMVPREDPEPVVATDAEPQPEPGMAGADAPANPVVAMLDVAPGALQEARDAVAPVATGQPETIAPVETTAAIEEDDGPTIEIPATVNIIPSPPASRDPALAQVAAAASTTRPATPAPVAPATTQASAPAVAAPAAAESGGWSMQIASQPSSDSAQATYQDLARRYGGVLQGRAVNIVRANIEGKGIFYRVRIPAATRDEAVQLCTRYKAAGGSCFVSR